VLLINARLRSVSRRRKCSTDDASVLPWLRGPSIRRCGGSLKGLPRNPVGLLINAKPPRRCLVNRVHAVPVGRGLITDRTRVAQPAVAISRCHRCRHAPDELSRTREACQLRLPSLAGNRCGPSNLSDVVQCLASDQVIDAAVAAVLVVVDPSRAKGRGCTARTLGSVTERNSVPMQGRHPMVSLRSTMPRKKIPTWLMEHA